MTTPFTRTANFINQADLYRSGLAAAKAKEMMGSGNPNTGAAIRKPASTFCTACGKWHRPGNVCPSMMKSQSPPSGPGNRVVAHDVQSGNPYRQNNGVFAGQPGGVHGTAAKVDCTDAINRLAGMINHAPVTGDGSVVPPPSPPIPMEPVRPPISNTLHPTGVLSYSPERTQPPNLQRQADALVNQSGYLQAQSQNYLDALRTWQSLFGVPYGVY